MAGLGTMMTGGNTGNGRSANDFYPTPCDVTDALLAAEEPHLGLLRAAGEAVWEPACGDGAICHVLHSRGFRTVATDLIDRGFGQGGVDFLSERKARSSVIITNPPFVLAEEFVWQAKRLGIRYLALLLKTQYFAAAGRYPLFADWTPAVKYELTWRPDFMNRGAPTMDAAWFVWRGATAFGETRLVPLLKPAGGLFS